MEEIPDQSAVVDFKIDAVLNLQMEINLLEFSKTEDQMVRAKCIIKTQFFQHRLELNLKWAITKGNSGKEKENEKEKWSGRMEVFLTEYG